MEQQGLVMTEYFPIGGQVGKMYVMTLQANGITEAKYYMGGTRAAGDGVVANANATGGTDTFYTGGQPVNVENYNVYKLTVYGPPTTSGPNAVGPEIQHYYMNSFPQTTTPYEDHETFPIHWVHDIPVPGGGVIQYLLEDRNCHAVDNCGPGSRSTPCTGQNTSRNVPNEPNLVVPQTFNMAASANNIPGAQTTLPTSVTQLNTITHATQPYHSQILHLTVLGVRSM